MFSFVPKGEGGNNRGLKQKLGASDQLYLPRIAGEFLKFMQKFNGNKVRLEMQLSKLYVDHMLLAESSRMYNYKRLGLEKNTFKSI